MKEKARGKEKLLFSCDLKESERDWDCSKSAHKTIVRGDMETAQSHFQDICVGWLRLVRYEYDTRLHFAALLIMLDLRSYR